MTNGVMCCQLVRMQSDRSPSDFGQKSSHSFEGCQRTKFLVCRLIFNSPSQNHLPPFAMLKFQPGVTFNGCRKIKKRQHLDSSAANRPKKTTFCLFVVLSNAVVWPLNRQSINSQILLSEKSKGRRYLRELLSRPVGPPDTTRGSAQQEQVLVFIYYNYLIALSEQLR